ncbi:MAG TPA: DUF5130 family protein [Thermoanaerobaculia bacterium]|nr:DUF5130 family protein [Thermoanaerobaculia bacterium]
MFGHHRRRFLARLDRARLEEAIREAERSTTGQVRVVVLPRVRGNLAKVAELTAERLQMHATPDRNGVLILVVPGRREFHVWGDLGIHEKVGDDFWKRVVAQISEQFQRGDFTAGLLSGIEEIGRQLTAHFPAAPGSAANTLPDSVVEE